MKIGLLHTLYGRRAGGELQTERVLAELARQKDIELLVYCNYEAYQALETHYPEAPRIYVSALNNQCRKALWLEAEAGRRLERDRLDVFWIPSGANSFPGRWKVPAVVTFCDLGEFFVKNKYGFVRTAYRKHFCIPRSIRRAAEITALSRKTADDLEFLFPLRKRPHVVLQGSSPRELNLKIENPRAVIRQQVGRDFDEIVFYPARTDYVGKGIDILLPAYKTWAATCGPVPPLVIAGPRGIQHEQMEAAIQRLELQSSVFWLDGQKLPSLCIDALYKISRLVVVPSRYEGFGYPVLEAMEHGVPPICSDAGSLPEVAGDAALMFPSGSAQELVKCLCRLHGEPEFGRTLVKRGKERLKILNWQRTVQQMIAIFHMACSNGAV